MNKEIQAIYIAVLKHRSAIKLHRVKGNEYTIIIQDATKGNYRTQSNPIYILTPNKSWRLRTLTQI